MRQQQCTPVDPSEIVGQTAEPTMPLCRNSNPRVLVVDDDHMVRAMVQLGLERNGFEVWLAATGREAIDLFQTHHHEIDVVLLDVRMPGLDGPHTLDALRELEPGIRACFMSGDTGLYELDELLERGAVRFIYKPFGFDHLVNILRLLADEAIADPHPSENAPI